MRILDLQIMKGPNYWSNYRHKVIVMKIDLEELEQLPTNKIDGFYERIKNLLPSLYGHRCSEGHEGGFFERVKEGTWMGHVIEHIALELQSLAGKPCGYGRTRSTRTKGVYNVIFAFEEERAGIYAAHAAIRVAEKLISGEPYDIQVDIKELSRIHVRDGLGPSTMSIIDEAKKRNIPYRRMDKGSYILFGQGVYQKKIRATMTGSTSSIGVEAACDKEDTKYILKQAHIPTPSGEVIRSEEELDEVIAELGFPIVIKPIDGNHGRGVTTDIQTREGAVNAMHLAQAISKDVIVERFVKGSDFRLLLINYKLVAAAKRTPAMVMGDGFSTIGQLIDQTNKDPNRGECHEKVMTTIKVDEVTNKILLSKNLTLQSVLPIGEILFLKDTANISTGGTSRDVTDIVHPYNVLMAERIAKLMNLDICGIDIVAENIDVPLTGKNGAIIEVNACPGFRMHLCPSSGLPRNVAAPVIDMLYPQGAPSRVPLVAVTGTNGKTTTTRLIAHMAKENGHKVGFTTTDGIYIQDHNIYPGDCTGAQSAQTVLTDPTIDFAVLECARGGIIRSGLGFDHCDISIVTNISEDHLGLKDIDTIEEMAKVKAVIPRSTFDSGYSILNADDDLVYNMKHELDCNIALFSMDENNPRIKSHIENGGLAAVVTNDTLLILEGRWKTAVCKVSEVPLTFSGKASAMIKNLMPAVLAGFIRGFDLQVIRKALLTFIPSPEQTPGRMNIFHFRNFDLMLDYAHNPGGFSELKEFLSSVNSPCKIGIITGVGDRRDEDIRNLGSIAAQIFDEIIIRHDADMRGRTQEELTRLLMEGISKVKQSMPVAVVSKEEDAIRYAIDIAKKGSFIVTCTDSVKGCIEFINGLKQKEEQENILLMPQYVFSKAS
ncbi:MAG: cyanophycin synthetase [Bacteroidia bacterium]